MAGPRYSITPATVVALLFMDGEISRGTIRPFSERRNGGTWGIACASASVNRAKPGSRSRKAPKRVSKLHANISLDLFYIAATRIAQRLDFVPM